jgi:hypothetical protein
LYQKLGENERGLNVDFFLCPKNNALFFYPSQKKRVTYQLALDSLAVWSVPTNLPQKDAKQCFQHGNAP